MARVATTGSSSCAMIAIGGIKTRGAKAIKDNEEYLKEKKNYKLYDSPRGELTVNEFYSKILYPTSQPLGETRDYPLDMLLDLINKTHMREKHTTVVLNSSQYHQNDYYWAKRLIDRGFKLTDKTGNLIGSTNFIFTRKPLFLEFTEEDEEFT